LVAGALAASCERTSTTPQPAAAMATATATATTGSGAEAPDDSPSAVLAREGFAALRMSDDERAALREAVEASDWESLPAEAFPERIRRFDGVAARLEGWMIPGTIERSKVLDFMLVRDNAACCFGGAPKDDEWVQVTMAPGTHATYMRYAKIAVTGVLEVGGGALVEGVQPPALRMRATECVLIEKPR
jgi:hypothetical protein